MCFNGLLSISYIFEYKYNVNLRKFANIRILTDIQQELLVKITLNNTVPVNISHT